MVRTVPETAPAGVELDERQRHQLHEASHRTLRVTMILLGVAFIVVQFSTDKLIPTIALAVVGIGTLVANSYFLRRAGVREELEEINVIRRARQGLITGQTARMFALMLFIQIGGDVANDGFDVAQLPSHLLMATMFALIGSWIEYGNARAELRKLESDAPDPAYTSGERIGRGIARIFRR